MNYSPSTNWPSGTTRSSLVSTYSSTVSTETTTPYSKTLSKLIDRFDLFNYQQDLEETAGQQQGLLEKYNLILTRFS